MKPTYQKPSIEIIEVANEGIIAISNGPLPNKDWGTEVINPIEIDPLMPGDDEMMA